MGTNIDKCQSDRVAPLKDEYPHCCVDDAQEEDSVG
jgi:hypothetical protein